MYPVDKVDLLGIESLSKSVSFRHVGSSTTYTDPELQTAKDRDARCTSVWELRV